VRDHKLDRRGDRENSGITGSKEQKDWERNFDISDVWRD